MKHCFTGGFHEEGTSSKITDNNSESPLTYKEKTGIIKHIQEVVFSDFLKGPENDWISCSFPGELQWNLIQVNLLLNYLDIF